MSTPDDLRRRLIDLADAAGPWDDPLPEVRRRMEAAGPGARPDRRRWSAPTDWTIVLVAAAVAVIAVGLGAFLATGGSRKSSDTSSAAGGSANRATADRATADPARACPLSRVAPDGALRLIAPSRLPADTPATVRARLTVAIATAAGPLRVYVVADGAVVAELVPTTAPQSSTPLSAGTALELSATGAFTRAPTSAGCGGAGGTSSPAAAPPQASAAARRPLSPGTYQLIGVVEVRPAGAGRRPVTVLVSRPVDVVVG